MSVADGKLHDPIKDLMNEIAAEQQSAGDGDEPGEEEQDEQPETPKPVVAKGKAQSGKDEGDEEQPDEGEGDEEQPAAAADDKKKAAPKKARDEDTVRERRVPVSRLNETEAKRRKAERERDELQTRVAQLEATAKGEGKPIPEDERKKIASEARAQARVEVMVENFVSAGYQQFGKAKFDATCNSLVEMGLPDNTIMIAMEATGSADAAARAIYALSQRNADELELVTALSPIRLGALLAKFADTTAPKTKGKKKAEIREPEEEETGEEEGEEETGEGEGEEEQEEAPLRANGKKPGGKQVSRAPKPVKPVGQSARVNDDAITDDLSEDQFTERFDRMMQKKFERRAH